MNAIDVANALDMLLHMLRAVSEGREIEPSDVAELREIIKRIEASR